MSRKCIVLSLGVIIFVISCVTVNIYFPAAAVQKAADELVEEVRGKEKKPEQDKEKGSWLYEQIEKVGLGQQVAHAQQIDIEVSTPAIRSLKESMKQRFPLLKPFYERENIGESNAGLLEVRDTGKLSLKEKSDLMRLVEQENRERKSLYSEIVRANKFGPETIPQVQKIFANSWREKSSAGWWIQKDNGEWVKK
ncbi:MAG: DUF1318 domain-containing protein [Nitrospira sp.]|nr:DUF1318 domain-containing protein [Nitrospira sp.]